MVRLGAVLLMFVPAAAFAATGGDVCSALSEPMVRTLTGVPTGAFTKRASQVAPGHSLCVYGVTMGNLLLDVIQYPSDAAAVAAMPKFGDVVNSDNYTTSPYGTDQVNELRMNVRETADEEEFDVGGVAVRHGSRVVTIGMNRPDTMPTGPEANKRLQGVALELAGAKLAPWPVEDLCARVPASAVQTLITLGAATVKQTASSSKGGNSVCGYAVYPMGDMDGRFQRSVDIKAFRYINDAEALADKKPEDAPSMLVAVRGGRVLWVRDRRDVSVLYRGEVGQVLVYQWEKPAMAHPSYDAHLQQVAFAAAGAPVGPVGPVKGVPVAKTPNVLDWAWRDVKLFVAKTFWVFVVIAPFAGIWWSRARRRKLIATGIPGTAEVLGVSDTGVTVNNDPRVKFRLRVTPEGGSPYETTVSQTVSRLQAPAELVGTTVKVKIDRKNPNRLIIT